MDEIQKEIWDTVLTYTKLIRQGKVDEFLAYFHEEYSGWNNIEPLPADKQSIISELRNDFQLQVREDYKIIPIKIKVLDELAIVHYYLSGSNETDSCNKIKHYTDVLVKNGNKWVLIADHFGAHKNLKIDNHNLLKDH